MKGGLKKMTQASNRWLILLVCLTLASSIISPYVMSNSIKNSIPEMPVIPTAEEIISSISVPTAEEIAAEIDMPDTILSVRDEKEAIAEALAADELDEKKVREAIADEINNCDDVEMDRHDITSIEIRDVDVDVIGDTAVVDMKLKVFFNNYEDEPESARIKIRFTVSGLDRDDDYEDAEIEKFIIRGSVYSCSTD